MDDALFAKLMGMGFEFERIQSCYEALSRTSTAFSLQEATEWLIDCKSDRPAKSTANTLVLTQPTGHTSSAVVPDIHRPVSSSRDLSTGAPEETLNSRYNLGAEHVRDKERFAQKEREEAVKKARERRREDIMAKDRLHKEIQADRRARTDKTPLSTSKETSEQTLLTSEKTPPTSEQTTPTSEQAMPTSSVPVPIPATCWVQVRLPSGRVLRRVFPSSATLNDIITFVVSSDPTQSSATMTLVQPFPRCEYTPAEGQRSLASLGLCPSTSLVVKQGGVTSAEPKPAPEPMEVEGEEEDKGSPAHSDDDSGSDSDSDMGNGNPPLPIGIQRPPHRGRGYPPIGRQRGAMFNPFNPGGDETFGGQGHRLGGREGQVIAGDSVRQSERALLAAKAAAVQRGNALSSGPPVSYTPSTLGLSPQSLESICTHLLVSQSNHYGMPSCSSISPLLAQRLIAALKQEKKLNSKTLMAFYKCPLGVVQLDNYLYATNELLANISHFPGLCELSLCSCPIITDRAMADMLPYLPSLASLKLNGCSQLSQAMFRALRGCKGLEVLELSHLKVSDEGLKQLLYYSLHQLRELDLSYTQITAAGLKLLPTGAPALVRLSVESTQVVGDYYPLTKLCHLRSLNLSRCPTPSEEALEVLGRCGSLQTLILSGMALEGRSLERLSGLGLKHLRLPDRNLFLDDAMETCAGFPLVSLDLSDYLHITDAGISCLAGMTSLTSLSLSRTKLTDTGMFFLEGILELKELCLDNTLVTNTGISHVTGLVHLEVLSLADTRVTSSFIIDGVLKKLRLLSKLNLSRTAVCDRGMLALVLPSLTMLNLDWTCVTMATSLPGLKSTGCPVLETLRNRNIGQPLPRSDVGSHDQDSDDMVQ